MNRLKDAQLKRLNTNNVINFGESDDRPYFHFEILKICPAQGCRVTTLETRKLNQSWSSNLLNSYKTASQKPNLGNIIGFLLDLPFFTLKSKL